MMRHHQPLPAGPGPLLRLVALLLLAAVFNTGCSIFKDKDKDEDPVARLADFKATIQVKKVWSAGLGGDSEKLRLALGPATDGTRVFAAAHDGQVAAFEATSGERLWRRKTRLPLSGGPATDGDVVVIGSSNGDVLALAADDGSERWRQSVTSEVLAAPAVAGDLVLVRSVDGRLTALDRNDGTRRWFVQQVMPRLSVRGTAAPVAVGDVVVCGFDNGKLAAYQLADGSLVWETLLDPPSGRNEIERLADINATVRTVGDDIYAVTTRGKVMSVALESGQPLWTQEARSHEGLGVDSQNAYVAGTAGELVAFTRQGGVELWRHRILNRRDISGPTPYRSSVVVGDFEGFVHFFATDTGEPQVRVKAGGGRVTSPPLAVNELLFVQTDGGTLTAFRQESAR